jgi:hypothetical protein
LNSEGVRGWQRSQCFGEAKLRGRHESLHDPLDRSGMIVREKIALSLCALMRIAPQGRCSAPEER